MPDTRTPCSSRPGSKSWWCHCTLIRDNCIHELHGVNQQSAFPATQLPADIALTSQNFRDVTWIFANGRRTVKVKQNTGWPPKVRPISFIADILNASLNADWVLWSEWLCHTPGAPKWHCQQLFSSLV